MKDMSRKDLQQKASNIYEAVVIMFKRARQINDEQKQQIDDEMGPSQMTDYRENEDFDEVEIDKEALHREHIKFPKPTRAAMEEMVQGKIQFSYTEPAEVSGEKKS